MNKLFRILFSVFFISSCCCVDEVLSAIEQYPIDFDVLTTYQRVVVCDDIPSSAEIIYPYEISKYDRNGYGKWHYSSGTDYVKRFDIMPDLYSGAAVINVANLLSFFTITDIHITDKESPAQGLYWGYKGVDPGAYSGMILYTTHVLDAAIQTINAIHKTNPFDFGISLGDACNATQYNELRWYIDVIDGKLITPSSGDHAGADSIDYQKPYQAAGLDRTINWYQAIGNHDHFWQGLLPPDTYIKECLIGKNIINLGNPATDPLGADSRGYYMGSIDGSTPYGDIIGVGPEAGFKTQPQIPAADLNRRSLLKTEWIGEFFNTSSNPKGHGFNQDSITTGFACYSFKPKSNLPIKIIVLDDTQNDNGPKDPLFPAYSRGELDAVRDQWLVHELDQGQADGELMVIAAHVPLSATGGGWVDADKEKQLIVKLLTYPNLILWIAGHRHRNVITAFKSPDAAHPELGFWQVETASLRDFPQQFRSFRIVRNRDNTISIITTDIDPAVRNGSPAATSRSYAVAEQKLFPPRDIDSYNAELIKQLTTQMQEKIQAYGTPVWAGSV